MTRDPADQSGCSPGPDLGREQQKMDLGESGAYVSMRISRSGIASSKAWTLLLWFCQSVFILFCFLSAFLLGILVFLTEELLSVFLLVLLAENSLGFACPLTFSFEG